MHSDFENAFWYTFLFQCAYCETNKTCAKFDLVKDTLNKACEGQEWKFKQCVGEQSDLKYHPNL